MCSNHGAVQEYALHVRVTSKPGMHLFPDVMITPTSKALIDRVPVAEFLWQKAPLGATAHYPEDAFDETATFFFITYIDPWTTAQETQQLRPLLIRYSIC